MRFITKRRIWVWGLAALALVIVYSNFSGRKDAPVPALLQGLPANFEEAREQLQTRLNDKFILPVNEQELMNFLSQQGFGVSAVVRNARFSKPEFACTYIWDIRWDSEAAVVTSLTADVGAICV